MSACATLHPPGERTQPVVMTKLLDPDEVATALDLFAPVHERTPVARAAGAVDWPRVTALIAMVTVLCAMGAGLQASLSSRPDARAVAPQPARAPAMTRAIPAPAPTIVPLAPLPEPEPEPPPPPPQQRVPARAPALSVPRPFDAAATLAGLNRQALLGYARREPREAMSALSRAVLLCRRPALAWHERCALTHLNLGVVLAGAHGQSGLAAKHFRIARAIRPGLALPARLASREIVAFAWEQSGGGR